MQCNRGLRTEREKDESDFSLLRADVCDVLPGR